MIIEVCVDSLESAVTAIRVGADLKVEFENMFSEDVFTAQKE